MTDTGKQCAQISEQYYDEILRYCRTKLPDDEHGAEDCTQEVFLLLFEKRDALDFSGSIRGWLYAAADRILQNYGRKQSRIRQMLGFDLTEIEDRSAEPEFTAELFASLREDELELLKAYYGAGKGERRAVARNYGMTLAQLYKCIHAIREKLRKSYKD